MKALLDLGQPYVSVNDTVGSALNEPPLLSLARRYRCLSNMSFDLDEKVFLLLERGADISARDRSGDTCLSVVLQLLRDMTKDKFSAYQEEEFKDILMCMITAGADVYASDQGGMTVSQTACIFGQEELWREVLAECGYDPDEVFSIENEFRPMGFQSCPGERVFSTVAPYVRPTKLSFKEYSEQRKLLDCVKKVYSREYVDSSVVGQECREFWESVIESSDSEDYEWASDMGEDEDDTDEVYSDDNEEYSSEDEEYDDDNMVEG
jgi:hypothetical protein